MKKPKYHTGTPLVLEFAPQYTIGTSPVPLPPVEDSDHKPLIGLQQEVHYEKNLTGQKSPSQSLDRLAITSKNPNNW